MTKLNVGDRVKVTSTRGLYKFAFGCIGRIRDVVSDPKQKVNHVKNAKFCIVVRLNRDGDIICTELDVTKL